MKPIKGDIKPDCLLPENGVDLASKSIIERSGIHGDSTANLGSGASGGLDSGSEIISRWPEL